jgi:hypothetical protein
MRLGRGASVVAILCALGCNAPSDEEAANNAAEPVAANQGPVAPPAPGTPGGLPDDRTPLAEPKGPIDPKSAEAAGQVVQHYGALIEQGRTAEAARLWRSADSASDFAVQLRRYPEAHLEIGSPGGMEGAAGSVYVTVPVVFYGRDENGAAFRRPADVILRRANDVPGSTEEQRRWGIERIDWVERR